MFFIFLLTAPCSMFQTQNACVFRPFVFARVLLISGLCFRIEVLFFCSFSKRDTTFFIYFRNSYFIWLPVFQMHLKNYIKPFLIILLPHSLSKKITNLFLFILFCKFIFFFLSKISLTIFSYKKQKTIRFLFESDVLSFFSHSLAKVHYYIDFNTNCLLYIAKQKKQTRLKF